MRCGTNKCQAKALESIQLRSAKFILGCSITTCDEPVRADLGLEALKCRRDFRKLKWYQKVIGRIIKGYQVSYYQMSG